MIKKEKRESVKYTKDYIEWLPEALEKLRKETGFPSINSLILKTLADRCKKYKPQ